MANEAQKIISRISVMRKEGKTDAEIEKMLNRLTPGQKEAINKELDRMLLELKNQKRSNKILQNPKLYKIG